MSLRGLWITAASTGEAVFSRRYATVEHRCRAQNGDAYRPLPEDEALFAAYAAACAPHLARPPLIMRVDGIWPVVSVPDEPLVYFCIPSVSMAGSSSELLAVDTPEITAAVSVLRNLSAFMRQLKGEQPDSPPLLDALAELNQYLNFAIPFGRPVNANFGAVRTALRQGFSDKTPLTQKHAAAMPYTLRGSRQEIALTIREEVRAIQYDMDDVPDVIEAHGQVICRAELDGVNDITLSFANVGAVRDVCADSCAQAEGFEVSSTMMFSPPLEPFPLLSYRIASVPHIPLRGFYQMKMVDASTVQILIQLKLGDRMSNNFEYCQVYIPFSHRGPIAQVNVEPSVGLVHVVPNRTSLIWNIGPKFTGKNREVALPGTITFGPAQPQQQQQQEGERFSYQVDDNSDPFCVDHNCFVRLRFKLLDDGLSGLAPVANSLVVYPSSDPRLSVTRELIADNYVIWNSLGDARYALPLPTDSDEAKDDSEARKG